MTKIKIPVSEVIACAKTGHGPCLGLGYIMKLFPDRRIQEICRCASKKFIQKNPGVKFNPEDGFYKNVEDSVS